MVLKLDLQWHTRTSWKYNKLATSRKIMQSIIRSVQGIQMQFQWCGSESLVEKYKTSEGGSNGNYIGDQDSIL